MYCLSCLVLNIGSASQLGVVRPASCHMELPASVMEVPYFGADMLVVAASLSGANAFATLVETVQGWMEELGVERDKVPASSDLYQRMIRLAESKLDTSLCVEVTLWGERHRPGLMGSISNVMTGNLSVGDVSSATFRGIVENLRAMMPDQIFQTLQV